MARSTHIEVPLEPKAKKTPAEKSVLEPGTASTAAAAAVSKILDIPEEGSFESSMLEYNRMRGGSKALNTLIRLDTELHDCDQPHFSGAVFYGCPGPEGACIHISGGAATGGSRTSRARQTDGAPGIRETGSSAGDSERSIGVASGPPLLIQSAKEAVRRWRYEPTYLNEEPVPMQLNVTVTSRLNGDLSTRALARVRHHPP